MNYTIANKYAELIVKVGVNVQKNQLVVVNCPVQHASFSQIVAKKCYEAGAKYVDVRYFNDYVSAMNMTYGDLEYIETPKEFIKVRNQSDIENNVCYIHLISDYVGVMDDCDPKRLAASRRATMLMNKNRREYSNANKGQWTIAALPNPVWAKKVFPYLSENDALAALEKAILETVYVNETNDPIDAWKQQNKKLESLVEKMNNFNFKSLHFTNSLGTDIDVPLVENHRWAGGSSFNVDGVEYDANMPTEEVFCMPDCRGTQGKVVASKPLSYMGKIIDGFYLEFDKGKVVNFGAQQNQEVLDDLIHSCEGADSIGEIALISYHSPISIQNILYFDTLFDENASCHMALGDSYSENIVNGATMSKEELKAIGGNHCDNHVDFMFGTHDMHVVGITHDGQNIDVFVNGDFVI